jgi:hypothetical protein
MRRLASVVSGLVLLAVACTPVPAGDWRFPIGLTYTSGFQDVVDFHEKAVGVDADFSFPVGLCFRPYLEFDRGHRIGFDVGPGSIILIDVAGGSDSGSIDYINFPLGIWYGYTLMRDATVTPYVRGGVRYNIASGDFVDSASPGFLAAIGLETGRKGNVGFGFEVAYDSSTVDLVPGWRQPEEIEASGVLVSFSVVIY